jgi:probable blue pigment (indigoidine) exporter
MWLIILMYALFASVFTVGKLALASTSPFFLTGVRMLLAGSILLLFQRLKNPSDCKIKKEDWGFLVLLAFFNVFITNAFEFWALQFLETSKTSILYSFSPFAAILFSYLFLKEKMSALRWLGLFIGLVGFLPLFLFGSKKGLFSLHSLPELAVSISAITAVIGWILMKRLMQGGLKFIMANAISFLIAGMMSLTVSYFCEAWNPLPIKNLGTFLWTVVYIATIHNVICYNIYAFSLKKFTVTYLSFAGFSNPLFTALLGWIFLRETVGWEFFCSLILIISGLYIYSKEELKGNQIAGAK